MMKPENLFFLACFFEKTKMNDEVRKNFSFWHLSLPNPVQKNVRHFAIAARLRLVGGGDLYTVLTNREPARLQAWRLI